MRKKGLSAPLPGFLSNSNIFPAFITTTDGEIVTANQFFKQLYNVTGSNKTYIHNIFTDNSFGNFLNNSKHNLVTAPVTINSQINNRHTQWEASVFDKGLFICTGVVTQAKNSSSLFSDSAFSVFFDNSPALMWVTDKEGRIQMMNKRYKEHTGFTDAQLGRSIWEVYPKEMADQFKRNDDIVLKTNELLEIEEVSIDKAGVTRNYIAYKFVLQTASNGVMVAGCSIDVTDILEKTKQLLFQARLLDSIEQAVYVLDNDTKIIYWNSYAEEMFGWKKEEILHKHLAVLAPMGTLDEQLIKSLQGKESWHGELDLKKKNGTIIQVHTTKSPVFDKGNNITAFIGIAKDISERKIVLKKLVKQNNQFRQIARLQSHAVRRPLANMLGLIDLIQYYSNKKEHEEVLYMISLLKQSSEDLDDIIRRIVLKAGVYFDPALKIA